MLMICSFFLVLLFLRVSVWIFFFVVECFIRTINQTINKKIVDEIAGAHCKNIKQNIYDRGSIHLLTRSLSLCFALLLFFQHLMVVFILIFKYYHIQISSNKKARTKQKERIYYWGCGLLSGVFNVENSPVWSLDKIIYIIHSFERCVDELNVDGKITLTFKQLTKLSTENCVWIYCFFGVL